MEQTKLLTKQDELIKEELTVKSDSMSIFVHKKRISIMSLLIQSECSFSVLKKHVGTTDGNLVSHLRALEKNKLVKHRKTFENNYPKTYYIATKKGEKQYTALFLWLERFWSK